MRTADDILQELRDRKIHQRDIARVLGVQQPNVSTLFAPSKKTGKTRRLGYDEAIALIGAFNLGSEQTSPIEAPEQPLPSEATFQTLLAEVMRISAGIELPEQLARPVARHLRLCLELLARNPAIQDNRDALKAVADAAGIQLPATTPEA